MVSSDMANTESLPTRVLWRIRDRLGSWFDLGRISAPIDDSRADAAGKLPIPGKNETSLTDRLPDDLRNTAADVDFRFLPFEPLYRTDVEFAAELSNQTVHAVMHLAWVDQVVYPALMRQIERTWDARIAEDGGELAWTPVSSSLGRGGGATEL
jgi:hypothetical protein